MSEDTVEYGVCGTRKHGGGVGLTRREQIATAIAAAATRNDGLVRRLFDEGTGVGEWAADQTDYMLQRLYRPRKAEGGAR
jgi:hypothetical protein